MKAAELSHRQLELLRIVAEGAGRWDARWIDITMTARNGAGEMTVLDELRLLEELGLVVADPSGIGVGGRWSVTSIGENYVERNDE